MNTARLAQPRTYTTAIAMIAIAALIWATDSLVRLSALEKLDPMVVVLCENLIGLLVLLPWILKRHGTRAFRLGRADFLQAMILGIAGSVVANLLFSLSLKSFGPATATIFEMGEPLFVVGLAFLFLREQQAQSLFQCSIWVIVNAIVICLGSLAVDGSTETLTAGLLRGTVFAVGASVLWAVTTVTGKSMLNRHSPSVVVFWRWLVATFAIGGYLAMRDSFGGFRAVLEPDVLLALAYLGVVAGIIPMIIYYHGLRVLPASVATFVELLYPLLGLLLPVALYREHLNPFQLIGTVALLGTLWFIVQISAPASATGSRYSYPDSAGRP